jgi:hypothetical protein
MVKILQLKHADSYIDQGNPVYFSYKRQHLVILEKVLAHEILN